MKIFKIFDNFVIASTLFLFAGLVKSCENDCQVGISNAFADKWAGEVKPIFNNGKNTTTTYLFYSMKLDNISDNKTLINQVTTNVFKSISDKFDEFNSEFIDGMSDVIQQSIFNQQPNKMKGDCNNPQLVKQPPAGVNWTMQDCKDQTYVCGNPPSVCHFMRENKFKCFENLKGSIQKNSASGGTYITTINNTIASITESYNLTKEAANYFSTTVLINVQNSLETFSSMFNNSFCTNECTEYDYNIKLLLLSFP